MEDFDADGVRKQETLTLSMAATAKLKVLAADKRMEQLWQTISPGKKAAARGSGSDGSSQPPIADAMRAAVAKVLAVAAAAQQAAAAVLTARARRPAVRPVVRPAVRPANEMT